MATTPAISVIVTTYNRPILLVDAVQSVLDQQGGMDFEVIVVDDGGPGGYELPEDPRVRLVVMEENAGLSAARNRGIDEARGDAITFLDDDDLLTPDRLELAVRGLASAPLTICHIRYMDDGPSDGTWHRRLDGDIADELFTHMTPHVGQACVRRDVIPRFREDIYAAEDIEWWVRVAQNLTACTVPEVGYLYRRHDGPRHRNGMMARVRDRTKALELHAEWFAERPRSAAFQWKRIGLTAMVAGEPGAARHAFLRSLRLAPHPRTAWHLLRTFAPSADTPK